MKSRSKFFLNSIIYITASFLSRGIGFLLLPILTRYLSPEEYGLVAMFTLWVAILQPLLHINTTSAIVRFYYDENKEGIAKYIGISIITIFTMSLVMGFLTIIFYPLIKPYLSLPLSWLEIGIIGTVFFIFYNLLLGLLRVREKAITYSTYQIIYALITAGISIYLIVKLNMTWRGRVIGIVITNILMGTVAYTILKQKNFISFVIEKEKIKSLLHFGAPLILHNLAGILAISVDKIFLNKMISTSVVGIYNVAATYAIIIGTIANSIHIAFVPYAYKKLKEKKSTPVWKTGFLVVATIFTLFLILYLAAPLFFNYYVGKEFSKASKYFIFLGLSEAFISIYYLGATFNFWYRKTIYISSITVAKFLLNVALNYLLIKGIGDVGAAVATLIASIFAALAAITLGWYLNTKENRSLD